MRYIARFRREAHAEELRGLVVEIRLDARDAAVLIHASVDSFPARPLVSPYPPTLRYISRAGRRNPYS